MLKVATCFLCLAAFEEPRRRKRRSKKQAAELSQDSEVSQAEVADESAVQDTAAAAGSTAWASKDKPHYMDLSTDRTVIIQLSLNSKYSVKCREIKVWGPGV